MTGRPFVKTLAMVACLFASNSAIGEVSKYGYTSNEYTFGAGYSETSIAIRQKNASYKFSGQKIDISRFWNYGFDGKDDSGLGVTFHAGSYKNRFADSSQGEETFKQAALEASGVWHVGYLWHWYAGLGATAARVDRTGEENVSHIYSPSPSGRLGVGIGTRGSKTAWQLRTDVAGSRFSRGRDNSGGESKLFSLDVTTFTTSIVVGLVGK